MFTKSLTTILLFALSSVCQEPGNGRVNPYCDIACQKDYRAALEQETAQFISVDVATDPFYESPSNISDYLPGDLVKWENISPEEASQLWHIPPGLSLSRFFYMSQDVDGNPIPATAFSLVPYSNPFGAGTEFRTVAWAHGTAGVHRNCGPSNHRELYYEWMGPFAIAQAGYAVIAPDYAGQGSDIPGGFLYEAGSLHAHDTSLAVQAARKAPGLALTHEWVVTGHSEGGLTAWRTNEREADQEKSIGGLLGAVPMAPALRPLELIPESLRRSGGGPVGGMVAVFVLQSVGRLMPEIPVEDYFSDIVLARLPLSDQGCIITGGSLYDSLTQDELFKNTSWLSDPRVLQWSERYNGVGAFPLVAPMLIIQGEADNLTYPEFTEEDMDTTCGEYPESQVVLSLYPELDHDAVAVAGQAEYLRWIGDRFDKVKLKEGCSKRRVEPAREGHI